MQMGRFVGVFPSWICCFLCRSEEYQYFMAFLQDVCVYYEVYRIWPCPCWLSAIVMSWARCLVRKERFLPESANFPFSLLKWKWSLFLSLTLLSWDWKSCSSPVSYCDNLLWLFCYCYPATYRRSSSSVSLLDIDSYGPSFCSFVKM